MTTTVKQIGPNAVQIEFPAELNSSVEYGGFVPIATPKNVVLSVTHSCQLRVRRHTPGRLKICVMEFNEHSSVRLSAMFVLKNANGGFIGKEVSSDPLEFMPNSYTHYVNRPAGQWDDEETKCRCQVVLCFLPDAIQKPVKKALPEPVECGHPLGSVAKMLEHEKFGDVQFECEGRAFKVCKLFLQAQLDVFDAMFTHDSKEKQRGVIEIKDAKAATVERLVRYLYTGHVEEPKDVAADLLPLAVRYQLLELTAICVNAVYFSLSPANIIERLELVVFYDHLDAFKLRVLTFTKQNYEAVRTLPEWKPFAARNGSLICELMELRL
ncbi:hypothetical protein M3Y99_01800400 [Aphelenchoides fujianensis]|nr:hypothetical protein M3Y99_01800400 [Aphelenchoides fujianensis]